MKLLENKIALVTGASRGIGKAIALRLAEGGAKVAVNYRQSEKDALDTVARITAAGGESVALKADLSSPDEVKRMFDEIEKIYGGVDILVNNAGILKDIPLPDMTDGDIDDLFRGNIDSVFYCSRHAAKAMMKKRYGKIVNIASASAFAGTSGLTAYAASKGAVVAMTKSMAKELGSRNIRVNAVAPGLITTDMTRIYPEEVIGKSLSGAVLKYAGLPEDIAGAVYFLAGPESDYITGQIIHVNGGIYL